MGKRNIQKILRSANFPAKFESLEAISVFILSVCKLADLDDSATYQVQLSVDEACSNIIEHAYSNGPRDAQIDCKCLITPDQLKIQLHDHGHAFNPLTIPTPDITASLEERNRGGLGIFFMRHYMDEVIFIKGRPQIGPKQDDKHGNYLVLVKHRRASK